MKHFAKIMAAFFLVCLVGMEASVRADDMAVRQPTAAEIGKKVLCPVMDIKFEVTKETPVIDYKDRSYFFCCDHCVGDFKKTPDKFTAAGEMKVRQPAASEIGKTVNCAVMDIKFEVAAGTPVIDYMGKSYYFCCDHCLEEFKKNPEKFSMK
ncbi:MAG TPA: YHS domain-containing protein [Geomobilimonas sp.]|nr:YHS domain-containing protein [Geomobilimonas sp.]